MIERCGFDDQSNHFVRVQFLLRGETGCLPGELVDDRVIMRGGDFGGHE
jgi:hypothetical protein